MKIESVTIYFKFIIPQELEGSINQIQNNFQFELIFQIQIIFCIWLSGNRSSISHFCLEFSHCRECPKLGRQPSSQLRQNSTFTLGNFRCPPSGFRTRIRPRYFAWSGSGFQISREPDPALKCLCILIRPRFQQDPGAKKSAERALKVINLKKLKNYD